jgi:hypothetical protein
MAHLAVRAGWGETLQRSSSDVERTSNIPVRSRIAGQRVTALHAYEYGL